LHLKKYSPSDTLLYMSSQSLYSCWFYFSLFEEIILCYLTLFSQAFLFRKLIKDLKVSICITLMCMMISCLLHILFARKNHGHEDTTFSFFCSDAYSQDTCNSLRIPYYCASVCLRLSSLNGCTLVGGVYACYMFLKAFIYFLLHL
jgi:hypothetical protein